MVYRRELRGASSEADLTARARIRDAAMDEFGDKGFDGATMRGIAAAAGVSVGLVQHHFGNKEGLRTACDQAVLELVERKAEMVESGRIGDQQVLSSLLASAPRMQRYVARAIVEGSPNIDGLFDDLVSGYERYLASNWPERFTVGEERTRTAAAAGAAVGMSSMAMHRHMARVMGVEPWTQEAIMEIGLGMFDVFETMGELSRSDDWRRLREGTSAFAARARGMGG